MKRWRQSESNVQLWMWLVMEVQCCKEQYCVGTWNVRFTNQGKFSSVQSLSHVRLFATPWTAARQASVSITNSQSLLKLMSSDVILCRPLLLLPLISLSIRVFSNESDFHIRWPEYWSFSLSISPSNEYSGLISFRLDWFDFLAVQGTLKSLRQYHSSKASILQGSAYFIVQLSHPQMTTWKTIALTRWTFVSKVISLLFNTLSRLVTTFLPRSKRLLISWLQSPSAVILEPWEIVCHCFHCFSIYLPWSDGTGCHILVLWMLRLTVICSESISTCNDFSRI